MNKSADKESRFAWANRHMADDASWFHILNSIGAMVSVHRLDGSLVFANRRATERFRLDGKDWCQTSLLNRMPPVDRAAFLSAVRSASAYARTETLRITITGIEPPFHLTYQVHKDQSSGLAAVTWMDHSIPVAQMDGCLIGTDRNGFIREWSTQSEALYGYSEQETLGKRLSILLPHWDRKDFDAEIASRLAEDKSGRRELVAERKDGSPLDIHMSLVVLRDSAGVADGLLSYSFDIGDRKKAERELTEYAAGMEASRHALEEYSNTLTRLVHESTTARRAAEDSAQSKSEFLAVMSHEIRTPLTGIIGMAEVMLSQALGGEHREFIETIRKSGEALLTIINDVLDFSKIEAGKLDLEAVEFGIQQVIREAVQIVKEAASQKSLSLMIEIDPELPVAVRGDPVRTRQILLNLLSNAIKFTAKGVIQVNAKLRSSDKEVCEIELSIKDQGIGITAEEKGRLFQPFAQADASTTRRFGGTGLGLAICKRLVGMMGGEIGVESVPGVGSTFWFILRVPAVKRIEGMRAKSPQQAANTGDLKAARLLLVEDNPTNRKVALLTLKRLGYAADVANDGQEAVEAAANVNYDLIFMDCQMPVLDGYAATKRIRESSAHGAKVPIVAMTANAFAEDRQACLHAGMSDYLSKPVRGEQLRAKLEQWLEVSRATSTEAKSDGAKASLEADLFSASLWSLSAQLQELVDEGQGEIVSELLELFLVEVKQHLAAVETALAAKDSKAVAFSAHSLKGGSGSVGASGMAEEAQRLQAAGESGNFDAAQRSLSSLQHQFKQVETSMRSLLKTMNSVCV